jgi:hypothetical protein
MTKTIRSVVAGFLYMVVAGMTSEAAASPRDQEDVQSGESRVGRVRALDAPVRELIEIGAERSETFRRLLTLIEATDGLVYVERARCRLKVPACLMFPSAGSEQTRVLRIYIDDRKSDRDAIASLGHELQHALEVLQEPAVRSTAAMHLFYHRQARRLGDTFETNAAIVAGDSVRAELGKWPGPD